MDSSQTPNGAPFSSQLAAVVGTTFLNDQSFPVGYRYDGWQIDGLSGIDYDRAKNVFFAVRDNSYAGGPNGRTPPR
jgi:hypothetical protein